jgi:GDP-4-dehydro-6-deoxy-D-mannose reductase
VVRARPFNHTGPGQDAAFVCSAFARQLAMVEVGRQAPEVHVGDLDPVRDFSDVRDVTAGYVALLERGHPGEAYNLCTGEGASAAEVLAILRTLARVPVRVVFDPVLRRASDLPRVVGSHARATRDTGWRPGIPLAETLAAVLDDWRNRVSIGT